VIGYRWHSRSSCDCLFILGTLAPNWTSVISMDPRKSSVTLWTGVTRLRRVADHWLEHEPKADVIPSLSPANCLMPGVCAVPEVIYPVVSDRPGVTARPNPGMIHICGK